MRLTGDLDFAFALTVAMNISARLQRGGQLMARLIVAATAVGVMIIFLAGWTTELEATRLSEEVVGAFFFGLLASMGGALLGLLQAKRVNLANLACRALIGAFLAAAFVTAVLLAPSRLGMSGLVFALPPLLGAIGAALGRIAVGESVKDCLGTKGLLGSAIGAVIFVALPHAIGGASWSLYGISPLIVGIIVGGAACAVRARRLRRQN